MRRYLVLAALALVGCHEAEAGSLRAFRGGNSFHPLSAAADASVTDADPAGDAADAAASDADPAGDAADAASDAGFVNAFSQDFDGTDERVTVADSVSLDSSRGAMTVSAWIKQDAQAIGTGFVSKFQTGVQSWRFQSSAQAGDQDDISFMAETTSIVCRSTAAGLLVDTWYNIAFIYDGSLTGATGGGTNSNRVKLCVNGVEQTTRVCSGTFPAELVNTDALVEIGARNAAVFHNGNIDEVAIIGAAYADCAAQYAAVSATSKPKDLTGTSNLLMWLSMGDPPDSITTLVDRSGNNNDGTPVNGEAEDLEADVP